MIEKIHLMILSRINTLGTLTEAARALNLTQPALTHAIRKLEEQIGSKVWIKEGRKLKLTQSGLLLLELADRILPQIEETETLLEQISSGKRGILRIGMECHPCYKWLQPVLASFLRAWPDVEVELKHQFQFNGIRALIRHEVDILISPDPYMSRKIEFVPVFNYEQVLATSKDHPLADREFLHPRDLTEENLIVYPVGTERLDIFTHFLTPASCKPANIKTIEDTDIMLQIVAAGRGVTALPNWLVDEYKKTLPLASVKLGEQGISKSIFIGTRTPEKHPEYLQDFIKMAEQGQLESVPE